MASESKKTVVIAVAANLFLAVAKVGAGLLSGSKALLAEGAHSIADTTDQVFLLVSLKLGEALRNPPFEMIWSSRELIEAAWSLYKKYSDHDLSLCDCATPDTDARRHSSPGQKAVA